MSLFGWAFFRWRLGSTASQDYGDTRAWVFLFEFLEGHLRANQGIYLFS